MFQEFPNHLKATLKCKYITQGILIPGDLNWVQQWVIQMVYCVIVVAEHAHLKITHVWTQKLLHSLTASRQWSGILTGQTSFLLGHSSTRDLTTRLGHGLFMTVNWHSQSHLRIYNCKRLIFNDLTFFFVYRINVHNFFSSYSFKSHVLDQSKWMAYEKFVRANDHLGQALFVDQPLFWPR